MDQKEKIIMINRMMDLVIAGSQNMPDVIFNFYCKHNVDSRYKPFYNLFADSFLSLRSFCILMRDCAWSQASAILRMAIEQVAAVFVITRNNCALDAYTNLFSEHCLFVNLTKEEQKQYAKEHGFKGRENDYFDYGWCKCLTTDGSFGRDQILSLAHLNEFKEDIKNTLNAFSHGTITIFQFHKDNWETMKLHGYRINACCFKLFDFLCCSFAVFFGEEVFDTNLHIVFREFKIIYLDYMAKTKQRNLEN